MLGTKYDISQPALDAGLEWGVWKPYNLKVDEITTDQGTQALASGDADIVIGSSNRVIGAIATGLNAKIIAFGQTQWPQLMIVATSSKAQKLEDLKGGKFGVTSFGSSGHYSVVAMAEHFGWSDKDYQVVPLGSLNGLVAGLKNHTIDAFAWSVLAALTAQQQGYGRIIEGLGDAVPNSPATVLTASDKVIKDRPAAVKAFCDGFFKAQNRFIDDPDASTKLVEKWGGDPAVTPDAVKLTIPVLSKDTEMGNEAFVKGITEQARATTKSAENVTPDDVKKMMVDCNSL